jgi:type II secretion system protein H
MMSRKAAGFSVRRAFTLLELLLVLMLIGISAATIVPHLNGTLGRWQLRETAHNLQATLQMASQWARVRQEPVVFALDARRGAFGLRPLEDGRSGARGLLPVGRQSFGQGVQIARMEGLNDLGKEKVLMFWPDGTSQAAMIVLTGGKPHAGPETVWRITLDDRGAVHCREKLADEAGE